MTDTRKIIAQLESLGNPDAATGMAKYGITAQKIYGVPIPALRKLAKETGNNHELALALFRHNSRETRILASMIDDVREVTESQIESWTAEFDSWELCDQCIMNLFEDHPLSWSKAVEWSCRDEEFVKRAAFVLMARLAVCDKKAEDNRFIGFFPIMEREASDPRNFVKKAINWALRQIGKRNPALNGIALDRAERIASLESKSAIWIARDAIRELRSEAVQSRLKRKTH